MKITTLLISIVTVSFLFFFFTFKIHAAPVFTEDFSNKYDKWQDVRETFDLWNIKNESAHVFIDTRSTLAELIPKPEYWNPEWKNYSFEVEINYVQGVDKMLAFWFQDVFNWYQIHFVGGNYILSHIAEGKEVWNAVGPINISGKNTLRVELVEGTISLFVNDQHTFTHTDPTFNNDYGSIALKAGAGAIFPAEVLFDSISVSLLPSYAVELSIPYFSQKDHKWADQEYDSAKNWSEDHYTIQDWGCLLSSIVMTLRYHSIEKFPNGEEITPETLNQWLQKQEDGFIGEGLINWSAITRLVTEVHKKYGTTKLEYSRVTSDQLQIAADYLQKSLPVIFQIPGHFLVGSGLSKITSTFEAQHFLILDPLYSYSKLSDHFNKESNTEAQSETTLISTRLLTPTNTDLSYIYIAHSPKIKISFDNQDETTFSSYQKNTDFLESAEGNNFTNKTVIHEIQKPEDGNYKFSLQIPQTNSNTTIIDKKITVYTYDAEGNFTNLSTEIFLQSNQKITTEIKYQKNKNSTITFSYTFSDFEQDLEVLQNNINFDQKSIYYQLKFLTQKAVKFENQEINFFNKKLRNRYLIALRSELEWYSNQISPITKDFLDNRLRLLAQP